MLFRYAIISYPVSSFHILPDMFIIKIIYSLIYCLSPLPHYTHHHARK